MPVPTPPYLASISAVVRRELRELVRINPSDRPWELPFAVAVAIGLPMLLGAWLGGMNHAAIAAIGAMAILYLPRTPLDHRMVTVMAAGFALIACYALGQLCQLVPAVRVPVIALVALLVTIVGRHYRLGPPGALFFVMAAAIGAYAPGDIVDMPARLGLFALGSIGAAIAAFLYSLHILRFREPLPILPLPGDRFDIILIDALIIAVAVGLSLGLAQGVGLEKPYWVPVSCLAVIQGVSLRAVWNRKIQRIIGTMIGLALTWVLVRYAVDPWAIALTIILLTFLIEVAIVRHYAFAAIFITPLTILLAETSTLGHVDSSALIAARFADTVVGSVIGLLGGLCLHNPALRQRLRRLLPATLANQPDR